MLCRTLRNLSAGRWVLSGLLCLALVWGTAAPPRVSSEDERTTSLRLRAPEVPLAALETNSGVRFEKHGQALRLTLHKPDRSAHPSSAERPYGALSRRKPCHTLPLLPRRFLQPRHMTPGAPNDAGDPFLAALSLS